MPVIARQNTHIAPYWGKHRNIKLGLNQLGIRNITELMYATLLPGLNNVSSRIRYYSFYCWIIGKFYENKVPTDHQKFRQYIRRAEYLLALINATLDDPTGVPGINYALASKEKGNEIDLHKGIYNDDGTTEHTYWANPGGILAQYYIASLIDMGIVGRNEVDGNLFNISKEGDFITGKKLADTFERSVSNSYLKFIEILNSRRPINISELEPLKDDFNMKVFRNKEEQLLLVECLLQKDYPRENINSSSHRATTIKFVLEYLSKTPHELSGQSFSKHIYDNYVSNCGSMTYWGWYAYYLDDQWQYWATKIFCEILKNLKGKNVTSISVGIEEFVTEVTTEVVSLLKCEGLLLKQFIDSLNSVNMSNQITEAFTNLLLLYKNNAQYIDRSSDNYKILNLKDENFCNFEMLVNIWAEKRTDDFIKHYIIEEIIYKHYRVSLRKLHQTGLATQKFIIEDGHLRYIDGWDSTYTSPRIDTLKQFLRDLGLIEDDNGLQTLTSSGKDLLNQLQNEYTER